MKRAVIILAALVLSGCAHLTVQLVTHAPEIAAYGAAAGAVAAGFSVINQADETVERARRHVEP